MSELTLTGERTLPGIDVENYWFRRHEAAYLWLASWCAGGVVLDAGCGEGYGAALLRRTASRVVALDYAPGVVGHVAAAYPSVDPVRGDLQRLPVRDGAVEVVATLQTIEHLHDQAGFVRECARVLRPAGPLLVTTPNRLTFPPGNPFHTRELSAAELAALLSAGFTVTRMLGVSHGPRLRRWERRHHPIVEALLAAPPETWSPVLRRLVASVTARDFVVSGVDGALDLVAVAVRR